MQRPGSERHGLQTTGWGTPGCLGAESLSAVHVLRPAQRAAYYPSGCGLSRPAPGSGYKRLRVTGPPFPKEETMAEQKKEPMIGKSSRPSAIDYDAPLAGMK